MKRKPLEWGFDLTDFPNANAFQALLKRHKLTLNVEYPYRKGGKHYPPPGDPTPAERKEWEQKKTFVWSNKEVVMTTANNPLTGEHGMTPSRQREVGYASYIGITGNSSNVRALTQDIKRTASEIKDESPRRRDFI